MKIYLVGGAVRDELLDIKNADKDYVVTGATPEQMLELGYTQVGKDFPVFLHPKTHEEYALARTETKNGTGYTGFICDFSKTVTLEEDLLRRDLTINAIAKDQDGNYIDPYKGTEDIKNRVLRHVSDAFVEDPLRVLRVARFYARFYHLGFKIAPETMDLMRKIANSGELETLTAERVFMELEKALKTNAPEQFILSLRQAGALKYVLPEIDKLFGIPGPKRWHPEIDSGVHTCMTLHMISEKTDNPITRFAMLCHDLGKGETPTVLWPHHRLHNELGLKPLKCLCQRLHVPSAYEQFAIKVIKYHSVMHHLYKGGGKNIVSLFDKLDAWRHEEWVNPFALCCKCDFLGRLGFENRDFSRTDYFLEMFDICKTVKAKEFVDQGFKGPQIGQKMYEKRVMLVEEYMKSIPEDELNDKNNEKPAALTEDNITLERKAQNSKKNKMGFFKKRLSSDLNFTETEGDYDL